MTTGIAAPQLSQFVRQIPNIYIRIHFCAGMQPYIFLAHIIIGELSQCVGRAQFITATKRFEGWRQLSLQFCDRCSFLLPELGCGHLRRKCEPEQDYLGTYGRQAQSTLICVQSEFCFALLLHWCFPCLAGDTFIVAHNKPESDEMSLVAIEVLDVECCLQR